MSNKHELDNMIFQLESKKDLKETITTQKALIEILGYLKELKTKDQRISELEKENEELKALYTNYATDLLSYKELTELNIKLKTENEELKLKLNETEMALNEINEINKYC